MLVKVLLGLVAFLAVFLVVVATRPSAYHVERQLEVAAPVERVFETLNDLHRFASVFVLFGSPLDQQDPNMKKTFAGAASGMGQSFAWQGGKEAGKGSMTIVESVPNERVAIKLEFVEPMKSTANCTLTLAGTANGTRVSWAMDGNHIFIGKAMSLFMDMDKMLGGDLEQGLARLKSSTEGGQK